MSLICSIKQTLAAKPAGARHSCRFTADHCLVSASGRLCASRSGVNAALLSRSKSWTATFPPDSHRSEEADRPCDSTTPPPHVGGYSWLRFFHADLVVLTLALASLASPRLLAATNEASNSVETIPPGPAPVTARELYNAGTRMLHGGKLSDAESMLQASLSKQDERIQPATLYNLAYVRFDQGSEELKKSKSDQTINTRSQDAIESGARAINKAEDALAGDDLQRMVAAYLQGRGARKELRAATKAVQEAMELRGKTLLKWQRALDDFNSAAELNPADTNAVRNAEIVKQYIAKLVDSLRKMQMAMMPMGSEGEKLKELLGKLRGKIPGGMLPGAPGGDEDDDEEGFKKMEELKGQKEGPSKQGDEMKLTLSPEEAGNLLEGLRLGDGRPLPIGPSDQQGKPQDLSKKTW